MKICNYSVLKLKNLNYSDAFDFHRKDGEALTCLPASREIE
ncbi:MAG: hypothetical protein R6V32_04515 [Bacteroidales bacterium]